MKNEILVTGATGFVGRHLTRALDSHGYAVRSFSRRDGDIARCQLQYEEVAHIFHLAAKTFVPASWESPRPFYEVNLLGTLNVLELCRRQGASLTLISSYVYGRPVRLPIDESHPVQAFNPYSQTKIMAEEIGRFYESHYGVKVTIVRPFNLYGPGQDSRFLIPTLVRQALDPTQESFRVADRRPRRDYLHVDDFVGLLIATLRGGGSGTYNAGSGTSFSVENLVGIVNMAASQNKPLVSEDHERPQEVWDVVADISKASTELGWRPKVSLSEGIRGLVELMSAGL